MAMIFENITAKAPKVFQMGQATITLDNAKTAANAIFLQFTVDVQRQLQPVPTLTNGIVWAAQPVQGTLEVGTVLVDAASAGLVTALTSKDKACKASTITIALTETCDTKSSKINITDAYCSRVTFQSSGQQGYVANNFTCQFTKCDFGDAAPTKTKTK